jgi:chemotaxis protein CheY-P-specific phosphatase CheC
MNKTPLSTLDELELDALTELVNLGVSKAALSLREMIGEQVLLSVPSVDLIARARAIETLRKNEPNRLVAVHQVFDGDIHGRALLIFPETRSLELVRAVTNGSLPLEDILELEHEALAETGNIILNGCLSTIANLLQRTLMISLRRATNIECLTLRKMIRCGSCPIRWTWGSHFSTVITEWSRGTHGWRPQPRFPRNQQSAGGSRIYSRIPGPINLLSP